jgi:SAM-dependent MidA family methyltransferase
LSLSEIMQELILADPLSSITFHQYMELALYHPIFGYYTKPREKVGKGGDFYTNSSVGPVYGEILGDVLAEMLDNIPGDQPRYLIEIGGGNGDLMLQVLNSWTANHSKLMEKVKVVMVERSPYHRFLQEEKLNAMAVQWVDDLEALSNDHGKVNGVVFSNELIDALPVYLVEYRSGDWQEVRVTWDQTSKTFVELLSPLTNEAVISYIKGEELAIPRLEGYRMEVNIEGIEYLQHVADAINDGYLITVDYGYLRKDLYIAERRYGSIMCYRNHQAIDNPLIEPGEMDITSHVNFSVLMDKAEERGLHSICLFTQSEFLINAGILDKLMNHQEKDPFLGTVSKRNRAIRQLIMPEAMGHTFKVLVQSKGKCPHDLNSLKKRSWI